MAKKDKSGNQKKKLIHRLRNKYRLLVINETTYDERFSARLSALNVISSIGLIVFFSALLTTLLVVYTPMKEWIPGYPSNQIRKDAYHASNLADSLEIIVKQYRQYNDNLKLILSGEVPPDSFLTYQSSNFNYKDIKFTKSPEDSILRDRFENEEKYNIVLSNPRQTKTLKESILFFPPLHGEISGKFNPENGHLGIDITGPESEPVLATLGGTVILSSWTSETGYVIQIMHENNLVSVYKHNSVLLHKVGDRVETGEPIAIIGNTGELSNGPHLHFELWFEGKPMNPEDFIFFNR